MDEKTLETRQGEDKNRAMGTGRPHAPAYDAEEWKRLKLVVEPRCLCREGCGKALRKPLNVFDWYADIPDEAWREEFVEVQFKNTRKGYYSNPTKIALKKGDIVAVEASPGHDVGEVTLTGRLVTLQMRKNKVGRERSDIKRVYRIARQSDIEKWEDAKSREHGTMIKARQIAERLGLNMKIGDVEFQGDGAKAIFYYIADERVDFRQLIKDLADAFKVRIEMKQIGARQEAGRIGGIGPCGRPLCCASWMSTFSSVSTSAARLQDISLNPQKLAGQCTKLKCCMNYEVEVYQDAISKLPPRNVNLETMEGTYYHFKTDVFGGVMTYSTDPKMAANLVSVSADRVREVIEMNRRGEKPDTLGTGEGNEAREPDFHNVVGQDDLTRFDRKKRRDKRGGRRENDRREAHRDERSDTPKRENKPGRENRENRKEATPMTAEEKAQKEERERMARREERLRKMPNRDNLKRDLPEEIKRQREADAAKGNADIQPGDNTPKNEA